MTFQGDGCPPVRAQPGSAGARKAVAIAVPTGVALGAGAVFADAAIPASDGTIGACYATQGGDVRFVDGPDDCRKGADGTPGETFIKFNQTGPAGPARRGRPRRVRRALRAPRARPVRPARPAAAVRPCPQPAAASDYLLEIDGIKGESADKKHKDTIEIESFSWGATNSGSFSSGGGGGAGQGLLPGPPLHDERQQVLAAAVEGVRDRRAHQEGDALRPQGRRGAGRLPDDQAHRHPRLVVQERPDEDSDSVPTDQFSLNFAKIEYSYKPQNADGSLGAPTTATYDLKAAKK